MAQDSVWLHMTTRRRKVKAQGLAGGWWWWRPGREEGTPVPGWPPPSAPGSGLAAPFLGQLLASFSSPCIRVTRAKGSRAEVQQRHHLFGKALGLFWLRAAFSLAASSLSSVFLKPQAWDPDTHSTELIPLWEQVTPAQEAMKWTHQLSAPLSCLGASCLVSSHPPSPCHKPRGPQTIQPSARFCK